MFASVFRLIRISSSQKRALVKLALNRHHFHRRQFRSNSTIHKTLALIGGLSLTFVNYDNQKSRLLKAAKNGDKIEILNQLKSGIDVNSRHDLGNQAEKAFSPRPRVSQIFLSFPEISQNFPRISQEFPQNLSRISPEFA